MDFDLFEVDDDDELLSSMRLELTPQPEVNLETIVLPEFQCKGVDNLKLQFSQSGFIRSGFTCDFYTRNALAFQDLKLTAYKFAPEQLYCSSVAQYVFGEACMNIQYLLAAVKGQIETFDELPYYQRRREVTKLFHLLLYCTQLHQCPKLRHQITSLRVLLNRNVEINTWKLIYFANSSKNNNECQLPAYHLLHGALEWKLLDLFLLQKLEESGTEPQADINNRAFKLQLECIFTDLLTCSLFHFAKKHSAELLHSSAFPCTCFKEFWLTIQLELTKWNRWGSIQDMQEQNDYHFWTIFNKITDEMGTKLDLFGLNKLRYCEFRIWMMYSLCMTLHVYRSNGDFVGLHYSPGTPVELENHALLEQCTQQFLNLNPNEEQTRIYISNLMPISLRWWSPKVNIAQLLWEHFHKRLNSSYYIVGAPPSDLAVVCVNGKNYLTKYRQLLANEEPASVHLSSYTLFTIFLGKTLDNLTRAKLDNQVQKLLGRIYAKFSLQKFLALNETGLHHLIELFIVLALTGDFVDLAPKLSEKLLSIAFEKVSKTNQLAIAKGHMALLILYAEKGYDMSGYVSKLLSQLQAVNYDLGISKIFADALLDIFKHADDFKRGETQLINAWLPNYLHSCEPAEQERGLEALHLVFVKFREINIVLPGEPQTDLLKAMNTFILPFVKQNYVVSFSPWMSQLAADFCINVSSTADTSTFDQLFKFFTTAQSANRQALPRFLLILLESDKRSLISASVIMHVWLKSLVLLTATHEDVAKLTQIVVQTPEFHQTTQLDAADLLSAKEPLCVFIAAVGKKYECSENYQQRCKIADALNEYLRYFEKWLQLDLKTEQSDLAFRFYSFIAIVIYNCGPLVYIRSNINCFFHVAVTRYVLPTSIQMGKPPEGKLAQLVHKIWPVLVQGIGRLPFRTDPYLSQTLTDLIKKWTPHFKISPNPRLVARPFIACLQADNKELSLYIFDKLTSLFLATQRRQSHPNSCLVITILLEIVAVISSSNADGTNEDRLEILLKGSSLLMLEHIMLVDEIVPSRGLLLQLFKRIVASEVFQGSTVLNDLLIEHLRIITKRHLAFSTFFYFEMLLKFIDISYKLVEEIVPFLVAEVELVEQKRGAGKDNRIRGCLHKLNQAIATAKQNQSSRI